MQSTGYADGDEFCQLKVAHNEVATARAAAIGISMLIEWPGDPSWLKRYVTGAEQRLNKRYQPRVREPTALSFDNGYRY